MTRIKEFKNKLTQEIIDEKFPWINNADIEDAVLGTEYSSLVWYNGIWKNGRWANDRHHTLT